MLKSEFFNTDQDTYIGSVYLSAAAANSSYSQKLEYSPFELLADVMS